MIVSSQCGHQQAESNSDRLLQMTDEVESWVPLVRKILVICIWIYVGYRMLPAAESGNRNRLLWYFIGLFAFYVPFTIIGFGPPVLMLIAMKNGLTIPSSVFDLVGGTMFFVGVSAGIAALHWTCRFAARQRPSADVS